MNLHAGPVGGEPVERDGPFLPDKSRHVAVSRQRQLDRVLLDPWWRASITRLG
jgi:hypothetical protein